MKVFICYGWLEGQWHGIQLRKDLADCGYQITNYEEEADIIIAHSAGSYMLSVKPKSKLILLIGLPNWPNKLIMQCTFEKVRLESKDKQWFQKTLWHAKYALFQPQRLFKVYKSYKRKSLPDAEQVILVHNKQDTFMNDTVSRKLAEQKQWQYKDFMGQHDDIWQNTSPYINLLKEYAAR